MLINVWVSKFYSTLANAKDKSMVNSQNYKCLKYIKNGSWFYILHAGKTRFYQCKSSQCKPSSACLSINYIINQNKCILSLMRFQFFKHSRIYICQALWQIHSGVLHYYLPLAWEIQSVFWSMIIIGLSMILSIIWYSILVDILPIITGRIWFECWANVEIICKILSIFRSIYLQERQLYIDSNGARTKALRTKAPWTKALPKKAPLTKAPTDKCPSR